GARVRARLPDDGRVREGASGGGVARMVRAAAVALLLASAHRASRRRAHPRLARVGVPLQPVEVERVERAVRGAVIAAAIDMLGTRLTRPARAWLTRACPRLGPGCARRASTPGCSSARWPASRPRWCCTRRGARAPRRWCRWRR